MTDANRTYVVHDLFDTLQGEGHRSGRRSVFLRLAGCNLWNGLEDGRETGRGACARWCDTTFTGGRLMVARDILGAMDRLWPERARERRWVTVTGGEPLLQLDQALVDALHGAGWRVALETNGTLRESRNLDWVCCSPKLPARGPVQLPQLTRADEVKFVLPGHPDPDRDWAEDSMLVIADALLAVHRYVQPLDPRALWPRGVAGVGPAWSADRCVDFVRRHPSWTLGLQVHKLVGLP